MQLFLTTFWLPLVPWSVTGIFLSKDVTFFLFDQENRNEPKQNILGNYPLARNSSIVVIIHGWEESRFKPWMVELKNVFLSQTDAPTVLHVDWSKPASQNYPAALYDCTKIGRIIANFIRRLLTLNDIPASNVHICGHSLGAHIAGFVGQNLQKKSLKPARITALDPAGFLFDGVFGSRRKRLTRTDAGVVVVLHTDGSKFGYMESFGAVDIFPNGGGGVQPGCPEMSSGWTLITCSHRRSFQFFIDALEHPRTLVATECGNYGDYVLGSCDGNRQVDLGGSFGPGDDGDYYLRTRAREPYGLGAQPIKNE